MSRSSRFGAFPLDGVRVESRGWAPNASSVAVRLVPDKVPEQCQTLVRSVSELPRDVTARADEDARILRIGRGEVELVADFENRTVDIRS